MILLGTTTSPYTRKVRILLAASGQAHQFLDTRTEEGAAVSARAAPLGKIPVLVREPPEAPLPDSSLIARWIWRTGEPALRAAGWDLDPTNLDDGALQVLVEGALDAAINHRYLRLDGFPENGYIAKQRQRVERTLAWLDARAVRLGRPYSGSMLSLGCALDWLAFRDVTDLGRWPQLTAFRRAWTDSGLGAGTEPRE
jgi:glutathione S-transferase